MRESVSVFVTMTIALYCTIEVHSCSVDPPGSCAACAYPSTIHHLVWHTMLINDGTANLRAYSTYTCTVCISKEGHCNEELRGGGKLDFEPVILGSYGDFSEGELNVNRF